MIPEIEPGTLISNRYLIQKVLGQGGFGRTYLAVDTQRFGDCCVLKEFLPATTKPEVISRYRKLFEQEAKILYQLQHPQIPRFFAWLMEDEKLFIVQEYIHGNNYSDILSQRLSQQGQSFSEAEVAAWLTDMLPVLQFIHERRIIHRDISLENIMLSNNKPQPILIDFGVVKAKLTQILSPESPQNFSRASMVGKIGYSPPEQIHFGQSYPCSDIYALGVCAIVLLSGQMPHMLMDDSLNWRWRSYIPVSESFATILEKMLANAPNNRYQSAKEAFTQLNSILHTLSHQIINNSQQNQQGIQAIFSPAKTKNFQNTAKSKLNKSLITSKPQSFFDNYPAISNQDFLDTCQRELNRFIGPFGSVLLNETIENYPNLTPKQLVETLVTKIPNEEIAEKFREYIYKMII